MIWGKENTLIKKIQKKKERVILKYKIWIFWFFPLRISVLRLCVQAGLVQCWPRGWSLFVKKVEKQDLLVGDSEIWDFSLVASRLHIQLGF